jgi:hypothetical protein
MWYRLADVVDHIQVRDRLEQWAITVEETLKAEHDVIPCSAV